MDINFDVYTSVAQSALYTPVPVTSNYVLIYIYNKYKKFFFSPERYANVPVKEQKTIINYNKRERYFRKVRPEPRRFGFCGLCIITYFFFFFKKVGVKSIFPSDFTYVTVSGKKKLPVYDRNDIYINTKKTFSKM